LFKVQSKKPLIKTVAEDPHASGNEQIVDSKLKPAPAKLDVVVSNTAEKPPSLSKKDDDKVIFELC
jgi:hypothetical protein